MNEAKKMGMGKKIGLACAGMFVLILVIGAITGKGEAQKQGPSVPENTQPQQATKENLFQEAVLKNFDRTFQKRSRKKACHITADFSKVEDKDISITITYDNVQPILDVAADTNAMVRATLEKLLADGHKPAPESISVTVWAHSPVKGETGASMVLPYGYSRYDYNSDSVNFKPNSN